MIKIDETKMAENVNLTKVTSKADIRIYDNCLPEEQFLTLKDILMGDMFPWFYKETVLAPELYKPPYLKKSPVEGYDTDDVPMFVHVFLRRAGDDWSPSTSHIESILNLINPRGWIRVKANLGWKKEKHLVSGWHTDLPYTNSTTAQLHINTNNGYTLLETGDKVESIENRLVLFPCDILHTGITQTDTNIRVLLNFNFFSNG